MYQAPHGGQYLRIIVGNTWKWLRTPVLTYSLDDMPEFCGGKR